MNVLVYETEVIVLADKATMQAVCHFLKLLKLAAMKVDSKCQKPGY